MEGSATLLYSASSDAELCFKKELETIATGSPLNLEVKYFVTKQSGGVEGARCVASIEAILNSMFSVQVVLFAYAALLR